MVSSREEGHLGDLAASAEADNVEDLRQQLALREQELGRVRAELVAAQARAASYEGEIARRDRRIRELVAMVADRDQRISAMRRTKTWRAGLALRVVFGAPLRLARAVARRVLPRETRRRLRQRFGWLRRGPAHPPAAATAVAAVLPAQAAMRTRAGCRHDVVRLPIIAWDFRFQRPQQMSVRFARAGHRVFYADVRFRPTDGPASYLLSRIDENIFGVQLPGPRERRIQNAAMDKRLLDECFAAMSDLREAEAIEDAVVIVDFPFWRPLAMRLRDAFGWKVVYDAMDRHRGWDNVDASVLAEEEPLARESDLVLAATEPILADQRLWNPKAVLCRNAVDFSHFSSTPPVHPEIADLPHPILGYWGAVSYWFDSALVAELAHRHPEWTFVLVGQPVGDNVIPIRDLKNVHLMGERPYRDLPSFAQAFDVLLIPKLRNVLTEAQGTLKLYEYLAVGKPIVACDSPEHQQFKDLVYIAHDVDEFEASIEKALSENDPQLAQTRREVARQHTWEARYRQIEDAIVRLYPLVSVVIPTYRNLGITRACLKSIERFTTYPNYEVIVVDNGSADGTAEYLRSAAAANPRLTILLNETNQGFARAVNQGVAAATGEYIVVLNNDTIVTHGWLGRLIRHLHDPSVGIVGAVTNHTGNEARIAASYTSAYEMHRFAADYTRAHAGQTLEVRMVALFCAAMRRAVWDEIGPLDERFEIGMFEDDDLAQRLRTTGYRIVCAEDVFVHHEGAAGFKTLGPGAYDRLLRENRVRFEQKWGTPWIPHKCRPGAGGPAPQLLQHTGNKRRVMLIGLDGGTWELLGPWIKEGLLPNLARLTEMGASGVLRSTIPPITPVAWNSLVTGTNPGKHGVFQMLKRSSGSYDFVPVTSLDRRTPALWKLISDNNGRVVVIDIPMTYPPEPVAGVMISGMGTPSIRSPFVYPPGFKPQLAMFGEYPLDVDYLSEQEHLLTSAARLVEHRLQVAEYLADTEPWTFFFLAIMATDRVQHSLWRYLDPRHPAYDPEEARRRLPAIMRFYSQVDDAIGRLYARLDADDVLIVASDHGFGPAGRSYFIHPWLQEHGYIGRTQEFDLARDPRCQHMTKSQVQADPGGTVSFNPGGGVTLRVDRPGSYAGVYLDVAPVEPGQPYQIAVKARGSPEGVYLQISHGGVTIEHILASGIVLKTSKVVSAIFTPGTDTIKPLVCMTTYGGRKVGEIVIEGVHVHQLQSWNKSLVYADPVGGGIYVNLKGRDPHGVVAPGTQYEEVRDRLIRDLLATRVPETNAPLVVGARRREDVYHGDQVPNAPDVLYWSEETTIVPRLAADSDLATADFGQDWTGQHRLEGMWLACGGPIRPGIRRNADIVDIAPTVLHLLGLPIPSDMDGQPLLEVTTECSSADTGRLTHGSSSVPASSRDSGETPEPVYSAEEQRQVEGRLRKLGYLD